MKAKLVSETLQPDKNLYNKFKQIFINVKNSNTNDPFYELNELLNPLNIILYDYDNYFDALDYEEKQQFKNANMIPELGIRILGFDSTSNKIFLVVDKSFDDRFINISMNRLQHILDYIWVAFGHETIHLQQTNRMKIKQNPTFKSHEDYYKNKQEIMAMAWSFIEEMSAQRVSDNQIINMLKNKQSNFLRNNFMSREPMPHPLLKIYKDLGQKEFKLFTKQVYKYLTDNEQQ